MNLNSFKRNRKALTALLICTGFIAAHPLAAFAEENVPAVQMVQQQKQSVSGVVKDSTGEPVIGANIREKGNPSNGTITDIDGNFSIKVNPDATLEISFIGYKTVEVKAVAGKPLNVILKDDSEMLEEVVVVGYGTMRKKDLTGSVVQIRPDKLANEAPKTVQDVLRGTPGLNIGYNADAKGGGTMMVRGQRSVYVTDKNNPANDTHNTPLIILDGMQFYGELSEINPEDIGQIDVLKDASATAIYGARGANGVVVITTKNGSKSGGKATVTFDSYVGFKKIAKKLDVLSPYEFALLDYERTLYKIGKGDGGDLNKWKSIYGDYSDLEANYAGRKGINWQDETLGRTALTQNYRVGVSGNTEKMQYSLAYAYYDEEGAMMYSGSKKHNISFNMNHEVNKWLSVNARISYDQMRVEGMGTSEGGDRFNKMQHILQYRPTIGINGVDTDLLGDEDPLFADDSGNVMQNPLLSAAEETKDREWRTFQANAGATIKLLKGLTFRNTTGMRYQTRRNDIFYGDQSMTAKRSSINGNITNIENSSFQTSNVLTYNWYNDNHNVTAMLGHEYVTKWTRNFMAGANNFPNDEIGLGDLSLGTPITPTSSENYDDKLLSFFARVNYNLMDKYLFTASVRADGSSKFGKNNKWGYFPAFSAAWRLGEEEFIKDLNIFSDLKFRIGYGLAGNNRIGSYSSLAIMSSVTYPNANSAQSGYASKQVPNPDLKWEANKTFNIGLDLGFFNQRLTISPEFYINRSSNLLFDARLPNSSGYSSMTINAGETENKGIDLTINSVNITNKDFTWNTTVTLSHNKNSVNQLTGEKVQLYLADMGVKGAGSSHKIGVGEPLGQFYGYISDGLYQVSDFNYDKASGKYTLKDGIPYRGEKDKVQPGMLKFKNIDGSEDNKITEDDKTVIGNAFPKFYGGINNTFTYKDFDLSIFLTYSFGNDVLNATKLTNTRTALTNKNVLAAADWNHRWVTINKETGALITDPEELAAANQGKTIACFDDNGSSDNAVIHSWAVEDGSYLKLSNITLGYTFPKKIVNKIGLSKLRLYATGNNLLTWTKYTGYDPEVSTMSNAMTPGVDFGAYPRSRSFVFGVNVAF